MKRCFICNETGPKYSYHKLPSESKLRKKWLDIFNKEEEEAVYGSVFYCSKHFKPENFVTHLFKPGEYLKRGSIPFSKKQRVESAPASIIVKFAPVSEYDATATATNTNVQPAVFECSESLQVAVEATATENEVQPIEDSVSVPNSNTQPANTTPVILNFVQNVQSNNNAEQFKIVHEPEIKGATTAATANTIPEIEPDCSKLFEKDHPLQNVEAIANIQVQPIAESGSPTFPNTEFVNWTVEKVVPAQKIDSIATGKLIKPIKIPRSIRYLKMQPVNRTYASNALKSCQNALLDQNVETIANTNTAQPSTGPTPIQFSNVPGANRVCISNALKPWQKIVLPAQEPITSVMQPIGRSGSVPVPNIQDVNYFFPAQNPIASVMQPIGGSGSVLFSNIPGESHALSALCSDNTQCVNTANGSLVLEFIPTAQKMQTSSNVEQPILLSAPEIQSSITVPTTNVLQQNQQFQKVVSQNVVTTVTNVIPLMGGSKSIQFLNFFPTDYEVQGNDVVTSELDSETITTSNFIMPTNVLSENIVELANLVQPMEPDCSNSLPDVDNFLEVLPQQIDVEEHELSSSTFSSLVRQFCDSDIGISHETDIDVSNNMNLDSLDLFEEDIENVLPQQIVVEEHELPSSTSSSLERQFGDSDIGISPEGKSDIDVSNNMNLDSLELSEEDIENVLPQQIVIEEHELPSSTSSSPERQFGDNDIGISHEGKPDVDVSNNTNLDSLQLSEEIIENVLPQQIVVEEHELPSSTSSSLKRKIGDGDIGISHEGKPDIDVSNNMNLDSLELSEEDIENAVPQQIVVEEHGLPSSTSSCLKRKFDDSDIGISDEEKPDIDVSNNIKLDSLEVAEEVIENVLPQQIVIEEHELSSSTSSSLKRKFGDSDIGISDQGKSDIVVSNNINLDSLGPSEEDIENVMEVPSVENTILQAIEEPAIPALPSTPRKRKCKSLYHRTRNNIQVPSYMDLSSPTRATRHVMNLLDEMQTLKQKISSLRRQVKAQNVKLKHYGDIIKALKLKKKKKIQDGTEDILQRVPAGPLRSIYNSLVSPNKLILEDELKLFASTLHFYSPRAYDYVRKAFENVLPHPCTVKKWFQSINFDAGFQSCALEMLIKYYKEGSKYINITFDEMPIRENLYWDGRKNFGYVDLGLEPFDNIQLEENVKTNKALVFMVISIDKDWKQPLGYFFIRDMSASEKAQILLHALSFIHRSGLICCSLTFNGHSSNITMLKELGANFKFSNQRMFEPFIQHPVTGEKVYIMWDASQAIRQIRNTLCDEKVLNYNGQLIKWQYFENLCKFQELKKIPVKIKIARRHIHFKNEKKDHGRAMKLLSNSVASELTSCEGKNFKEFSQSEMTTHFITHINDATDILTSNIDDSIKVYKEALNSENIDVVKKRTSEIIDFITGLKCGSKSILQSDKRSGFTGLLVNLNNIFLIQNIINVPLRAHRLLQQHLELFFDAMRAKTGFENHSHSAYTFAYTFRKLLLPPGVNLQTKPANTANRERTSTNIDNIVKTIEAVAQHEVCDDHSYGTSMPDYILADETFEERTSTNIENNVKTIEEVAQHEVCNDYSYGTLMPHYILADVTFK